MITVKAECNFSDSQCESLDMFQSYTKSLRFAESLIMPKFMMESSKLTKFHQREDG